MTKKQEKIKEAYGQYWNRVKDQIDENGWLDRKETHKPLPGIIMDVLNPYDPKYCYYMRPVSLSGLEDNNGWISIESEADFPTEDDCGYFILKNGKPEYWYWPKHEALNSAAWLSVITHWKKIETHKPPIY